MARQPKNDYPGILAWGIHPDVGEVYVLGQQHASFKKASRGEIRIGRAAHALVEDRDGVMAGLRKQTL